jgi:hypothetical protein
MAKIWKEKYDWSKHQNKMYFEGDDNNYPSNNIEVKWIYFVKECSFVFEFHSIGQLKECQKYYSKKVRPSSIIPEKDLHLYGGDQSETQRWFERLPMKLLKEKNRIRVLKALNNAIIEFEK